MKLNLGCGYVKLKDYINCDIDSSMKPDKIVDLTKRMPFKTNSVDEILVSHTLEHIDQETLMMVTLPEIWRICKPNAKIKVIVPYLDAHVSLEHKTRFREDTFNTWYRGKYDPRNTCAFHYKFNFEVKRIEYGRSKVWGWLHYIIPLMMWRRLNDHLVEELRVDLRVVK